MNVLVLHDHFDDEDLEVYELAEGAQGLAQAKAFFEKDVEDTRRFERIDEANTWWNDDGYGQLVHADGCRTTYDVSYMSKIPTALVANTSHAGPTVNESAEQKSESICNRCEMEGSEECALSPCDKVKKLLR